MPDRKSPSSSEPASNITKVSVHGIGQEYGEAPELTPAQLERAVVHGGDRITRPGRPPNADPQVQVTLKLSREVLEHFRAT